MKHMRRIIAALSLSLTLALGAVGLSTGVETATGSTPTAEAATEWTNYQVAPKWWGWCAGWGNGVRSIHVVNHTRGGVWHSYGDKVAFRARQGWNQLTVSVQCKWSTPQGVNVWIRSDRSGQTHYAGFPAGSWSN